MRIQKYKKYFELQSKLKVYFYHLKQALPVGLLYNQGIDITSKLKLENLWMIGFEFALNGFEKGGKRTFDVRYKLEIQLENIDL